MKHSIFFYSIAVISVIILGCEKEKEEPKPKPIASFKFDTPDPPAGYTRHFWLDETINFINTSQNATSYKWDFDDGTYSAEVNPSHSYTTVGFFTVKLTAKGLDNQSSTFEEHFEVNYPAPIASFTVDKVEAKPGDIFTFTNSSTYAVSYLWDFGDGNTSTEVNPTHSYSEYGTYTVTLTAKGQGNAIHTYTVTIVIPYPAVIADFSMDRTTAKTGAIITFTNLSQNATSYSWDFGNGSTSTEANPTYSYSTEGTYRIRLTAIGLGGENSTSKNITITNVSNFDGAWKATITESDASLTSASVTFNVDGTSVSISLWSASTSIGYFWGMTSTTLSNDNSFTVTEKIGSIELKFTIKLESSTSGSGTFTYLGKNYPMSVSRP